MSEQPRPRLLPQIPSGTLRVAFDLCIARVSCGICCVQRRGLEQVAVLLQQTHGSRRRGGGGGAGRLRRVRVVSHVVSHTEGAGLRTPRRPTPASAQACDARAPCTQDDFPSVACHLLEYDERYSCRGDFSFYDYNEPQRVPEALHGAFDVVVADPPYLAEECLVKTAECVVKRWRPRKLRSTDASRAACSPSGPYGCCKGDPTRPCCSSPAQSCSLWLSARSAAAPASSGRSIAVSWATNFISMRRTTPCAWVDGTLRCSLRMAADQPPHERIGLGTGFVVRQ